MKGTTIVVALSALVCSFAFASGGGSHAERPAAHSSQGSSARAPGFLPASALAESLARLPAAQREQAATSLERLRLEETARMYQRAAQIYPQCTRPGVAFGAEPAEPPRTLREVLRTSDTALIGRVTLVTPGWSNALGKVVSLVEVRVDELLANVSGAIAANSVVAYIQEAGAIEVMGRRACSRNPGFFEAKVGDRVLLVGAPRLGFDGYVTAHYVLPVSAGKIISQPYRGLVDQAQPEASLVERLR